MGARVIATIEGTVFGGESLGAKGISVTADTNTAGDASEMAIESYDISIVEIVMVVMMMMVVVVVEEKDGDHYLNLLSLTFPESFSLGVWEA
jgi:hypothetical protein